MKFWKNEKGNLVIELERDQDEVTRLAYMASDGARYHRDECRKLYEDNEVHVRAAISGMMISIMLNTYIVGSNYTQESGSVEEPKELHIKDLIRNATLNEYNTDKWNEREIEMMKNRPWEEII